MWRKNKWSAEQYMLYSQQMAHLLDSGIPLLTSLDVLKEQRLISKRFYKRLVHLLNQGFSLSNALEKLAFPALFISFIRAAEEHGDYAHGFKQCESYYETRAHWTRELGKSLIYPLLVLAIASLALLFLLGVVLPRFTELYQMMDVPLPGLTAWLFTVYASAGAWMPKATVWVGGGLTACVVARIAPRPIRAWLARGLFCLPLVGSMLKHRLTHFFAIQLGSLLKAGVPLLDALQALRKMTPWPVLDRVLNAIVDSVMGGASLSEAISKSGRGLFLPSLVKMVALGEESGKLDQILLHLSHGTGMVIKNRLERFTRSAEPLFIFIIGLFIAVIIIAMFLPLLHLVRAI
ncbi:type II secretion system F family protein [Laceyella sacchari]|uniref:Type II secretion system F family protein n=1 Tax=Laceyella sacchari TaxID=37482 RepID=A0ABY5TZJ3_LACSH|nr:type II secretion system F family protein [Laceyella sacchari]UWE02784.1 type II secretion system F family protein [Laceyella sacchari]